MPDALPFIFPFYLCINFAEHTDSACLISSQQGVKRSNSTHQSKHIAMLASFDFCLDYYFPMNIFLFFFLSHSAAVCVSICINTSEKYVQHSSDEQMHIKIRGMVYSKSFGTQL